VCFWFARLATSACGISPAASELWCSGHLVIFYRLPSSETGTLDALYILTDADHKVNNYNDLDGQGGTSHRACSLGVCANARPPEKRESPKQRLRFSFLGSVRPYRASYPASPLGGLQARCVRRPQGPRFPTLAHVCEV